MGPVPCQVLGEQPGTGHDVVVEKQDQRRGRGAPPGVAGARGTREGGAQNLHRERRRRVLELARLALGVDGHQHLDVASRRDLTRESGQHLRQRRRLTQRGYDDAQLGHER